jgi:hypothetical protein
MQADLYAGKFKGPCHRWVFAREVEDLVQTYMPTSWRCQAVQVITDAYIEQTGESPDPDQLTILADYILMDDLKDTHPDKVANTEYPILSDGQLRLRFRREPSIDLNNFSKDNPYRLNGRKKTVRVSSR